MLPGQWRQKERYSIISRASWLCPQLLTHRWTLCQQFLVVTVRKAQWEVAAGATGVISGGCSKQSLCDKIVTVLILAMNIFSV